MKSGILFGGMPTRAEFRKLASTVRKHKDSFQGSMALVLKPGDLKRASMLSILVRLFGVRMEVFEDVAGAVEFIYQGRER